MQTRGSIHTAAMNLTKSILRDIRDFITMFL